MGPRDRCRGELIDPARLAREPKLAEEFDQYLNDRGSSQLRARFSKTGTIERLWRVSSVDYQCRFERCQKFFESFYKGAFPDEGSHDAAFALHVPSDERHWSAHLFPDEKVAFYGFNSCHRTDQDWNGAQVAKAAIDAAIKHAERFADTRHGWSRVAVGHHGVRSDRGVPDLLSLEELAKIANLQPALGIHGHTHQDESSEMRELLRYPFPIISTGSFAVARDQRPDTISNQFAVINLTRSLIRTELYRRARMGAWERAPGSEEVIFARNPSQRVPSSQFPRSRIGVHARKATIDDKGIAKIAITLERAHVEETFCLARPVATLNNIHAEPKAFDFEGRAHAVRADKHDDGSLRCTIDGTPAAYHEKMSWSYWTSNSFALTQADLSMRPQVGTSIQLPDGYDCFAHILRSQCGELQLEIQLPWPGISKVSARAECQNTQDPSRWDLDKVETSAIEITPIGELPAQAARMRVREPIPGRRYVLLYRPERPGVMIPRNANLVLKKALSVCRNGLPEREGFRERLDTVLGEAISLVLGAAPGQGAPHWVAYLWHDDHQRLLPGFGRFPAREWCTRFAYGEGIIGHGFRVRGPAIYFERVPSPRNGGTCTPEALIFRTAADAKREGVWLEDWTWVIGVPILLSLGGPAVGMVGFADLDEDQSHSEGLNAKLEQLAEAATEVPDDGPSDTLNKLIHAVSVAFWRTVSTSREREIGQAALMNATRIFEQNWCPPRSPSSQRKVHEA